MGTPGIYSATYSGVPVWEFQFGAELKEHVMRRRQDDYINATHILKAAGFDKPARTRILEREVQKDVHEKIQGGYGKYQGTWIPLEQGGALAQRNGVYDKIRPIFEFQAGGESPPPAPRHSTKPKAPRAARPAVPTWNKQKASSRSNSFSVGRQGHDEPENGHDQHEDDTPDNLTVASASYMGEDDPLDVGVSTGHRKRKREETIQDLQEQQHQVYGDNLLDYFMLSRNELPAVVPDPPTNFQPDWPIDRDLHTALHWASAMGDVGVIRQLKRFGADVAARNVRGATSLIRAVNFTNCFDKQTFPKIVKELLSTVDARDIHGRTALHHAAQEGSERRASTSSSRYYLDNILNKLLESYPPEFVQQLIDAQDVDGNTALHLAARRSARKCVRALIGRGASVDIANNEGVCGEDMIKELNARAKPPRATLQSSSPFGPEPSRPTGFRDVLGDPGLGLPGHSETYNSESARTVQSRITPLVLSKIQDLARSFENELADKEMAEKEARRILLNTQNDLANLRAAAMVDVEPRLEPEDVAAKVSADVATARSQLLAHVRHRSRIEVQEAADRGLAATVNGQHGAGANGAASETSGPAGEANGTADDANGAVLGGCEDNDSPEERLRLATELRALLEEQRAAEFAYVDARSMVGTGERIERYRHLLKSCLGPGDEEMLDTNLDDMIKLMEEDADAEVDKVAYGQDHIDERAPLATM